MCRTPHDNKPLAYVAAFAATCATLVAAPVAAHAVQITRSIDSTMTISMQGIRNAIPALSNEVVINIKDSSVLSVVGVFDLMLATTTVAGIYYRQMEVYVVAALIYLVMTYVATRLLTALAHKLDVQEPGVLPSSN